MQIVKVWNEDLPKLREKIINLWINEGVLSKEEANKRVNEVICAALDDNLEVMAICSGSPIYSEQLKEWFLYYRHFTNSKFRNNKLSIDLFYAAKEFFNNNRKVNDVELKGLYIVYENEIYNKYYTKLVNDHGVILIGWTPNNNQIRVAFFDDVQINPKNLD
jgi:hypothetical protein